ncbi:hypothetical protein D3C85_1531940 [compost metagenome]
MGEYAEDEVNRGIDDDFEWARTEPMEDLDEPITSASDVAEYQLATVFYDFHVHPEAQEQILSILKFYGDGVIKELL